MLLGTRWNNTGLKTGFYYITIYFIFDIAAVTEIGWDLNNGVFSFVKALNVPVNNFSVMLGRRHRFLRTMYYQYFSGSKCVFAQGHNTGEVGIKPPTSRSGVRGSTTRPLRSPQQWCNKEVVVY